MIIVNDNVFNADVSQPHIIHGTLDPAVDFANETLTRQPVGTLYISRTGVTGQPCNITVTAACLWVKEGTPGSPCSPAGSKSDWRRVGTCGGFILGTTPITPGAAPWCAAERGDIYEQSITGQSWKLYHLKAGNACDAPWINLSKGCVFEDTHTPVGSMDADLCALPVASFVHVDNVGTFLKIRNNCDGNDWVPLQTDLSNVEDMRNLTLDPNDAAGGRATYDVATRTLNLPPHTVVGLRKDSTVINVAAGATINVVFTSIDIDTTQNNASAITTNVITLPFNGFYRVSIAAAITNQAAETRWLATLTKNGADEDRWLWTTATSAEAISTEQNANFTNNYAGGATFGVKLKNLDSAVGSVGTVVLSIECVTPR